MNNALIHGYDETQGIVSVEASGPDLVIFKEVNGEVVKETIENTYWLITSQKVSSRQIRLEGDQYFKWLATFPTLERQREARMACRKNGVDKYDIFNAKEASLVYHGMTYFKGLKPKDVSILSFDLEADSLVEHSDSTIYMITNTFRKNGQITRKGFFLEDYDSQAEMLRDWCRWVREVNPSIMCGHNIYGYDWRYLRHVARLCDMELLLGRDKSAMTFNPYVSKKRKDGSQDIEYTECFVYGREIVDTMFLALTYDVARKFDSYGLKPIIKHLGLEKPGRTFIDASKMRQYWKNRDTDPETWALVKKYAEEDSDDALKLFDVMIPSFFYFTQSVSKSFQQMINSATGSQINNMMVRAYLQDGHSIAKATELVDHVQGGISFAVPGIYRNLQKIDLKSAYPSQILRFKLYDRMKDPKAYFYEMTKFFTYERFDLKAKFKETGDDYYYDREQSSKVFINSAYGLTNTAGLNYNSPPLADKITSETRNVIDLALKWASGKDKNYWITKFKEAVGKDDEEESHG